MNKTRVLIEVGSGCCLLFPFVGYAASAAETPLLPDTWRPKSQPATELPYPVVGLDPAVVSPWEDSTSAPIETIETLNLQGYDAQVQLDITNSWQPTTVSGNAQSISERMPSDVELSSSESLLTTSQDMPLVTEEFSVFSDVKPPSLELPEPSPDESLQLPDSSLLGTLFVELDAGESSVRVPTLVKGAEDGQQAIAFDQWLIPFDDVLKAFNLTASLQTDGQLALSSPDFTTKIRLESLPNDPELGVMWSIADIYQYLGASAEFDRERYSIRLNRAAVNQSISGPSSSNYYESHYESIEALLIEESPPEIAQDTDLHDSQEAAQETKSAEAEATVSRSAAIDQSITTVTTSNVESSTERSLGLLLVGLSVDDMTTVEATLVKGREDGARAIAFDQWLIPFDDAIAAASATVTREAEGQLFIRAPGIAKLIDPTQLTVDPDLGLVFSIAELSDMLGLNAEFSFSQYAVNFQPNELQGIGRSRNNTPPVVTAGLPVISPTAGFNLGSVRQSTSISGSSERGVNLPVGQLTAVGSLGGGSWYTRLNQPTLSDASTWQLSELQYVNQSDTFDYSLGSQPTFWRSQSTGSDYWGATAIRRWGFSPPDATTQNGFNPSRRMQSDHIERSVSGEAEPGTFVQLVEGIRGSVVAETLVDSSGLYRFEDVPASGSLSRQYTSSGYVVRLYPDGLLTNEPEVRSASFTTLPGQLPQGAATLVSSVGVGRQRRNEQFIGDFDSVRGGVAYRYGVSEALSLGGGVVFDDNTHGLLEAFYVPDNLPLQAAVSALVDLETGTPDITASARYQPFENVAVRFNSSRFSQRLAAEWRVTPRLRLNVAGNTREQTMSVGANTSYRFGSWFGGASASIDTRQQLRWGLSASNGDFNFSHRGNELSTQTALTYKVPSSANDFRMPGAGHELSVSYDTIRRDSAFGLARDSGNLALMEWQYGSPQRGDGGRSLWSTSLGYGVGSQGSGPVASVSANLGRGFELQARYQGVSAFGDEDSFRVSLTSRLGNRGGLGLGHVREDRLRSQGGLLVQPFFDTNANGQMDADEPLYLEDPELLIAVNNKPVTTDFQSDINQDGLLLTMRPGTHRVELDPAGLPLDRTADVMAYAVDVKPGQFTTVPIPLVQSYTLSGVLLDAEGVPVGGSRVEAISDNGHRQVSVTNNAGVYYLERLKPEIYDLVVDGQVIERDALSLAGATDSFQTRGLRLRAATGSGGA